MPSPRSGRDHDSSEIRRLRERVAALEQELARCRDAEDSLRTAADAADAASRAKDEFLAFVGHELRNPLAPIVTALELRRLRGEDPAEPEWEVIDRQVRHLVRMVDDLMGVQRLTRGRVVLQRERIDIAAVIADALSSARPALEARGHEVRIDLPPAAVFVEGDPGRLGQVVTNLLTHAANSTDPRGRVTLTAARDRGEVVVRVRDTGIGIAPDMLERVFDLFVHERRSAGPAPNGLGLGLAIVLGVVRLHGGTVEARSEGRGRGSEFVVRLPAAPETPLPSGATTRTETAFRQAAAPVGR